MLFRSQAVIEYRPLGTILAIMPWNFPLWQVMRGAVPLFLLLSATLFFNAIGVAWFYQAIEDFKYITIRTLIVRVVSLVTLFVFVKNRNDLFYYAAILVIANVGSNVFNFFRLRKYILFIPWKELNLWKHLKPALRIFILNLMISIYVLFIVLFS